MFDGIEGYRVRREILFRDLVQGVPSTTYATHGLYTYPAKFIPHVVRYSVEKYTELGDWVFDPFAGYGTVAIEASLMGRNAVLWDLNPMTKVFVYASLYRWGLSVSDFELDWEYDDPFYPVWDNILYWHPREFYDVLSRAWGFWHKEVYGKARNDEEIARSYLVAIPLLKVTRYFSFSDEKIAKLYRSKHAKEKVEKLLSGDWKELMLSMYRSKVKEVVEKVLEYQKLGPKPVEIVVRCSEKLNGRLWVFDALRERLDRDVRLMITSPPYLQAQEYIRSFKLELAWLGFRGDEIGILASREIPYNTSPSVEVHSRLYDEYRKLVVKLGHQKLLQLYDAYFKSLVSFLNNNYDKIEVVAMFVGPVKVRNIRVPIDEILKEHLETLGFQHVETLIDKIVARRLFSSRVNPATELPDERTPTEHLLVMRIRR